MLEECVWPVETQLPEWIVETRQEIRACETIEQLMDVGELFYNCGRTIPRLCSAALPDFRRKASELCSPAGRVVVVDLSAIFFASFEGKDPDAVDGTLGRLKDIYRELAPKKFIVSTDCQGTPSFRHKMYEGYKATRSPKAEGFEEQIAKVEEHLRDKGVQVEQMPGFESDDIMCSISYRCKLLDVECFIVTDDKDLWQALGGKAAIYAPHAREYRNCEWLMANHSIRPSQVVDWLCLVGKDNAPSAYKIGEDWASKLLKAYGDFWGIWDYRSQLTDHKCKSIEDFAHSGYWMARDLHALRRNLPITVW